MTIFWLFSSYYKRTEGYTDKHRDTAKIVGAILVNLASESSEN
jgi:hypothetical protein